MVQPIYISGISSLNPPSLTLAKNLFLSRLLSHFLSASPASAPREQRVTAVESEATKAKASHTLQQTYTGTLRHWPFITACRSLWASQRRPLPYTGAPWPPGCPGTTGIYEFTVKVVESQGLGRMFSGDIINQSSQAEPITGPGALNFQVLLCVWPESRSHLHWTSLHWDFSSFILPAPAEQCRKASKVIQGKCPDSYRIHVK